MKISVSELEEVAQVVLQHLRASAPESMEVAEDFYWHVVGTERYDPYKKPTDLTLGQLSDDWSELRKLLSDRTRLPSNLDLVWLASILLRIGDGPRHRELPVERTATDA